MILKTQSQSIILKTTPLTVATTLFFSENIELPSTASFKDRRYTFVAFGDKVRNNDITKDTSYRAGTSEDISKWGKNDFIKRTASLIKERLEIEDNYKLAAALIGDSDRQIDWYFPLWLVEHFTEAINRADDKKKYLFSLLKKPELWKLFMSFLESESFNGRGL